MFTIPTFTFQDPPFSFCLSSRDFPGSSQLPSSPPPSSGENQNSYHDNNDDHGEDDNEDDVDDGRKRAQFFLKHSGASFMRRCSSGIKNPIHIHHHGGGDHGKDGGDDG